MRMATMRALLLWFALAPAAQGQKTPIITTDLVYGTIELLSDIYDEARTQITKHAGPAIQPALAAMPKDPILEVCKKVGCKKEQITKGLADMQAASLHAKSVVADLYAQVSTPLAAGAETMVDKFESVLPKYKGLIPKTFGDLGLFVMYFMFVLYVVFSCVMLALRITFRLISGICGVCCCCCCRRSKSSKAKPKEKAKAAPKPKPAATNAKKEEKGGKKK